MSLAGDAFRADCQNWEGYKPCPIQKAQGLPDCSACTAFSPIEEVRQTQTVYIATSGLDSAKNIGLVEAGGLGSVLRTTAVSRAIRERNPEASIYWFTHRKGRDLLRYVPGVQAVPLTHDRSAELAARLDVVVNFESTTPAVPVVRAAKHVIGFALNEAGKFYGTLPSAGYMQRLQIDDRFRRDTNRLTMQQVLLRTAGLDEAKPRYDTQLTDENARAAQETLQTLFPAGVPERIVNLVIGSSEKGRVKRWPVQSFAKLAECLAVQHQSVGVVINQGPDDSRVVQAMRPLLPNLPNVAVMSEPAEVGDYLALIKSSGLVISGDTFGMHAGFSQSTPTIALAGPYPAREIEAGPESLVLHADLPCEPCYGRCNQAIASLCMRSIDVDTVLDYANLSLASSNSLAA